MKIDILSHSTLKLTLTAEDMSNLELHYEELSGKTPESRRVLKTLLCGIRQESTLRNLPEVFETERYFVEAFPRVGGGCLLYISAAADFVADKPYHEPFSGSSTTLLMFGSDSEETLGALCRTLERGKAVRGFCFGSRLYTNGREYRLLLLPKNACAGRIKSLLREYGELITDELQIAHTEEFFRVVIPSGACEKAAKCF